MKHKRHQKDRKDKNERTHRYKDDDHRYYSSNSELGSKSEHSSAVYNYKMKDISQNYDEDSTHPKKLIIYIVIFCCFTFLFLFIY